MLNADNPWVIIVLGVLVGVFSGVMGLGGGAVMIPIMVLALGISQTKAHGTSLAAMLLPVALPAVLKYHREGHVDLRVAAFLAVGIVLGSYSGARIATSLPADKLKLVFGFVLVYVAGYTIFSSFGKEHIARTTLLAGILVIVTGLFFVATKLYDDSGAKAPLQAVAPETRKPGE